MRIYQYDDFPDLLIKFSTERRFLQDLADGRVYMNESGYFRQLEDGFRGDKYDGKCPITMNSPDWYIEIGPVDNSSEKIRLSYDQIRDFSVGFANDDKIPLFCCSEFSEEILTKPINNVLYFKDEFIREMEQFGEYYIIFYKYDLLQKMYDYVIKNGYGWKTDRVKYKDIKLAYNETIFENRNRNIYDPFFVKDLSYKWQNEWRILLKPPANSIIGDNENHHVAQIPPLQWYHIGTIEELRNNAITISVDDEVNDDQL